MHSYLMLCISAEEINRLYYERYGNHIDIRDFLNPVYNDTYVKFNVAENEYNALYELGYISDSDDEDTINNIDISDAEECDNVILVRICKLLYINEITDDEILIDVSW